MPAAALLVALTLGGLVVSSPAHGHGDVDERVAAASARIEREPASADHYLTRSVLKRNRGAFAEALDDLARAERLEPTRSEVDLLRGKLYLAWDQPQLAVPPLTRFLATEPHHPIANALLARALARVGHHQDAAAHYARAIEREPVAIPEHYLERARALRAAGAAPGPTDDAHLLDALRGLDEGLETLGPVVALAVEAIEIEVELGRVDAALARLDALEALSARRESWLARRGEILEAAGRQLEARASYATALQEIGKLPPHRRRAPATAALDARARGGLARLAPTPPEPSE